MTDDDKTIKLIRAMRDLARDAHKTGGAKPFEVGVALKKIDDIGTEWLLTE